MMNISFNLTYLTVCQDIPIGVSYKDIIPDGSLTASSIYDGRYAAKGARLHTSGTWEPKGNSNPNDYLQIDLGKVFFICALATQGNAVSPNEQEWTTEYKISTSVDNNLWTFNPNNSSPKVSTYCGFF